ncbi:zinc finger BED domain-containing protein 6-like [Sphaerodactylus townsendi]|uniref:zinc finger BED domain-containing protein 6-like n=1 Tax=Sphaerodactylus townsendi TaxID=933632 RepID=UPI00202715E9|nr:zinc finger BED domain-containing protein 6-like [Sphaerodactylus townsendi]
MRRLTQSASGPATMMVPEMVPRTYQRSRDHVPEEATVPVEHALSEAVSKTKDITTQMCLKFPDSEPLVVDLKTGDIKEEVICMEQHLEDIASQSSAPDLGLPSVAPYHTIALQECPASNRASTSGVCSAEPEPSSLQPKRRKTTSYVWEHFSIDNRDRFVVVCNRCRMRVRLGKEGGCGRVGTSAMHKHLQIHHPFLVPPKKDGVVSLGSMSMEKAPQNMTHTQDLALPQPARVESTMSQLTVDEPLERNRYLSSFDPVALQYNEFLAEYLAEGMLPYSTVEEPSFLRMLKHLRPGWRVPGYTYFATRAVPALSTAIKTAIQRDLELSIDPVVHLTVSIWTSNGTKDYMTIMAHWVSDTVGVLVRRHAALAVCGFEESLTTSSIAHKMKVVVSKWLDPLNREAGCVACDGGATVEKAVRNSNLHPIPCVARCLDLVVERVLEKASTEIDRIIGKAQKVSRHFQQSRKARLRLAELQALHGLPQEQMKHDEKDPVGWNATLAMLEQLCTHQRAIDDYLIEKRELCLTFRDWRLMQDVVQLLEVFKEATSVILHRDSATLGHVLPLLRVIEGYVEDFLDQAREQGDDGTAAARLASDLLQAMKDSRQLTEIKGNILYQVASFLDPRFKDSLSKFLLGDPDWQIEAVKEHVIQLTTTEVCLKNLPLDKSTSVAEGPPAFEEEPLSLLPPTGSTSSRSSPESSGIWTKWCMRLGLTNTPNPGSGSPPDAALVAREEVGAYVRDYVGHIGANTDPLMYWQQKRHTWPSLFLVAVRYTSCTPTSICSKMLFSAAVPDMSANLSRLSVNTAEVLSFIHMNRQWIPEGFTAPPPISTNYRVSHQQAEDDAEKEEEPTLAQVVYDE